MPDGPKLFDDYLVAREIKRADAARQLKTSVSAVHYWIKGGQRPRADIRKRIARWTGGEVPESSWLTEEEASALEGTEDHDDPGHATGTHGGGE